MKAWKLVASTIAVALVGTGPAYAAIPNADGSLSVCFNANPAGASRSPLYPSDSDAQCPSGETRVTVGQTGARGATGEPGPTGPAGGTAATAGAIYERMLNSAVFIHNGASKGTGHTVTLSLPRGTFAVDSAATLGGSNFVEVSTGPDRKEFRPYPLTASCVLTSPGRSSISGASGPSGQGSFMVSDHATIVMPAAGVVSLKCSAGGGPLIGSGAELSGALRVSAVQISGDPAPVSIQTDAIKPNLIADALAVGHSLVTKLGTDDASTGRSLAKILKALKRIK